MILSGVINMKPLLILSLLFILTGCGDSEIAEEKNNEIYQQRAYARYDEACDKFNMTQTELNFCSNEIAEEIDKEIIELTKNSEDFSLEDFKEWADEAIDQEYPCQDPVTDIGMEKLVFSNIMFYCEPEIYGGSGPQNNVDPDVCKNYTDNKKRIELHHKKRIELRESETDRMFDDNGKCLEQIDYGSIQPLRNNLFYIQKGEEYKAIERRNRSMSVWVSIVGDCIYEISLHVPTKVCIAQMEEAGGVWFNDSIMVFEKGSPPPFTGFEAIDITKAYTDEVYYTGEITFTDDNNKRDILYLIYGHDFSHRVMNYENGKLNSMSSYVDQGGNPVLLEWYKDGVLTFQYSAAHEAKDRGINYSDLCKPAAEPGGWRSCGHIKFSEQEEGVSK
jgi:hypothetical protein